MANYAAAVQHLIANPGELTSRVTASSVPHIGAAQLWLPTGEPAETCLKSTLATAGSGYPQLRLQLPADQQAGKQGAKYYMSKLLAGVRMGRALAEGEEGSHLCEGLGGLCQRPSHLYGESGDLNKSRQCCVQFIVRTPLQGYMCPHFPACLFARPDQRLRQ